MDEVGFAIKTFMVSVFVVFCLQSKMGDQTVEKHVVGYLKDSVVTTWMRQMGGAATQLTVAGYNKAAAQVGFDPAKIIRTPSSRVNQQLDQVKEAASRREAELMDIENR